MKTEFKLLAFAIATSLFSTSSASIALSAPTTEQIEACAQESKRSVESDGTEVTPLIYRSMKRVCELELSGEIRGSGGTAENARILVLGERAGHNCYGIPNEIFCHVTGPAKIELFYKDEFLEHELPEYRVALCYSGTKGLFCVE